MRADLILLCFAYVLSQFYRAFMAVLTQVLERDIGATPEDLAMASGLWFLTFAAMQIPVGWALDRIGPRITASSLLLLGGGGGAMLFAMATTTPQINLAMMLIGIGCSPVLMASYYIFARVYPAAMFATLGAVILGTGSLGNLAGSLPMAMAAEAFGWRATLMGLAGITVITALGLFAIVKDPPKVETTLQGSVLALLKMPAMWLIFPLMFVQYAPSGGLRGLWIGPYFTDAFAATGQQVGQFTLIMGIAMICGTFFYGPLDRIMGTRKWVVAGGNGGAAMACFALFALPADSAWRAVAIFALIGFLGASFPQIMAHGRSFFPPHLVGRGVTLMNLFGIGGVGVFQVVTGRIHRVYSTPSAPPEVPYDAIFLFFGVLLVLGLLPYLFSRDRLD